MLGVRAAPLLRIPRSLAMESRVRGFGAVLRWQLGRAMTGWLGAPVVTAFPFATLAANAAGSLAMGLLAGWLARHGSGEGEQLRLLLGVGLLGGFTTFSAFGSRQLFFSVIGVLKVATRVRAKIIKVT